MHTTPLSTVILSSSGRYWAVSRLTSILLSSSLVLINSLSLLLNRSSCLRGALREGSIHLRGNYNWLGKVRKTKLYHNTSDVINSLDARSRKIFPGLFTLLNILYWVSYLYVF